jgi:hypothetical protein
MNGDGPQDRYQAKPEPFGRWLLDQHMRGDPEAVRKHLRGQQADGDVFQAVDDAESAWAGR